MTWGILGVNVVFLLLFASAGPSADTCTGLTGEQLDGCLESQQVFADMLRALLFVTWVVVDVALGVVWLAAGPSGSRTCPECGWWTHGPEDVCSECGHIFPPSGSRTCPECGWWIPSAEDACPACGHVFRHAAPPPKTPLRGG